MRQSSRLVLNTGVSYARMLVTIGFALVSTRLFVHALGHDEFGVFMLLFAAVGVVSFLTDALGTSLVRHLAHRMESPGSSGGSARELVSTAVALLGSLAVVVALVATAAREFIVGLYEVPAGREGAGGIALALLGLRMGVVIIGSAFRSAAMARQAVPLIAAGDILAAIVIFAGAITLSRSTGVDRLVLFGWIQVGAAVVVESAVVLACIIKFPECRVRLSAVRRRAAREVLGLAGWSLAGNALQASRLQGAPMLMNRAFGPAANATWSLAGQVSGYLGVIGATIVGVCAPALTRAHARRDHLNERRLTLVVSKYACLAMVLVGVPAFIEMPALLSLWLDDRAPAASAGAGLGSGTSGLHSLPIDLVGVAQWLLLAPIAASLSMAHATNIYARGGADTGSNRRSLRVYTLLVHALDPLALLVAWIVLRAAASAGHTAETWMVPAVIVGVLALQSLVRAAYVGRIAGISLLEWLTVTVLPVLLTGAGCAAAAWSVHNVLDPGLGRLVLVALATGAAFLPLAWFVGLAQWEREAFRGVGGRSLLSARAVGRGGRATPR